MSTTTELLAALEAATGPSRELDAAIFRHIGLTKAQERHARMWCRMDGRTDLTRDHFIAAWAPAYTASLDDALTLVPDVCDFIKFVSDPSGCGWEIGTYHLGHPDPDKIYQKRGEGSSDGQFALALCIAAIRARGEG